MIPQCLFVKLWVHTWYCAELAAPLFFYFMSWPTVLSYNSGCWWQFWTEESAASVIHTDLHLTEWAFKAV